MVPGSRGGVTDPPNLITVCWYHRVDYDLLWNTLERDVPVLGARLRDWALDRGVGLDLESPEGRTSPPPSPDVDR